jgi:hypothetical protein
VAVYSKFINRSIKDIFKMKKILRGATLAAAAKVGSDSGSMGVAWSIRNQGPPNHFFGRGGTLPRGTVAAVYHCR